jgi:hypothetical protein
MGGLLVDTSRRPANWNDHLKMLGEMLQRTEDAARSEASDLADFGDFLPGPELIDGEWTDADF